MDFGAAPPIEAALLDVVRRADFGYLSDRATAEMAEACARWQADHYHWAVDPARIRPLPDVITGLQAAITVFSRPGSPVILPTPAYMPFLTVPRSLGREIIQVPMTVAAGDGRATLDLDGIDAAFRRGGHLLVLCNPCNPVGRVYTRPELAGVAEVVDANGGLVFADEIHAPLIYPGGAHIPYASISELTAEHTVTATAASKGWNLPGLKCAQLILSNDIDAATWAEDGEHVRARRVHPRCARHHRRLPARRALARRGRRLPGRQPPAPRRAAGRAPAGRPLRAPEGTYLAWLDCRDLLAAIGPSASSPAEFFLAKAQVVLTDGAACGDIGAGHARLNFATPRPILTEIVRRLAAAAAPH